MGIQYDLPIHSSDLRQLGEDALYEYLSKLTTAQQEELKYLWEFWARPNQLEPQGKDWDLWIFNAGRGSGKTRSGAEWVRHRVKAGDKRIACVAPTKGDIRRVMVEGESGLLNVCWKKDKTYRGTPIGYPEWSPTNSTLSWENGAVAQFFSAEDPDRLRGPQFHSAWCFTAGHYIDTPYGKISVEKLVPGNQVETSEGPRRITHTSVRNMPVGVVKFCDGTVLEGTYDHPIYTQRGWVPLGQLRESDSCLRLNMTDTSGELTPKATTIQQAKELFTAMLLKRSMATLPGMTCIMSMGTNSITTQATCNSFLDQNISNCTTANGVCPTENRRVRGSSLATVVGRLFSESVNLVKGFIAKAASTVGLKSKERQLEPVVTAERVFGHGWELCAASVALTWQPTGVKSVYNLRVEGTHEYFCNGILTHNCDEVSSWRNQQDVWDMLMFCLRLGRHPRVMVTTTPKPTKLMRYLLKHPKATITTGSTFDNAENLAGTYLEAVKTAYEGTRLGRQELYAEILEEAEGALWTTETLDNALYEPQDRDDFIRSLQRIVVSVDPAITANAESDMTGIIVAGIDVNGTGYILEDATERLSPQGWASKAISLYNKYSADRIVAERNQGGEMVRRTLEAEDETVPIRLVHASRGKYARAEPISALYEQGKVKHLRGLDELETQMRTWEPLGSIGSPDRLDACVWALTDLMLHGVLKPTLQLAYKPAQGLMA